MTAKSGSKSKESSESWESILRKTLSKDRLLTFTRPVENSIHWIHLLDPFDQQETWNTFKTTIPPEGLTSESSPRNVHTSGDRLSPLKFPEAVIALAQAAAKASGESRSYLSGWPLIPFSKVQMFKCEKCCLEFCSPVNHRRHLRVIHRRVPHAEKEDLKSQRKQLATFWDSLSPQEASKIVDAKNLALEDLAGEKVASALSQLLQQPGLFALPHSYVKSGAMLLELVQCRSSRVLLTSSELFKILDGSSERTFPSFGLNAMQRYVFEGGAGKVGLEAKNLVSSLGFLVELSLVKAFIKDKDEEARRCQTALMEEEEASRRKQAQLQEKKRMRKARQRDSKEKDHRPSPSPSSGSSDDEELSDYKPAMGHDLLSRPSSNTFENLYDRLAGEEIDYDYHLEAASTTIWSSADKKLAHGLIGEEEGFKHYVEDISNVVCSVSQDELAHHRTTGTENVGFEDTAEGCANNYSNKGDVEATVEKKPLAVEKRKYFAERSFEEMDVPIPFQKQAWKERHHWSVKSYPQQNVSFNTKGVVEVACPEMTGSCSRQLLSKPTKIKRYSVGGQNGMAVWTKKAPKSFDSACDLTGVDTDSGDLTSKDMQKPSGMESNTSAEILYRDNTIGGVSSIFGSVSPSECIRVSSQPIDLATSDGGTFDPESQPSNSAYCHDPSPAKQAFASLSSVVVGTVVIGSLSVSLVDSVKAQDGTQKQLDDSEDDWDGRMVSEVLEGESTESGQTSRKVKELVHALHENAGINCPSHKGLEKDVGSVKFVSQVDYEEKENFEHSLNLGGDGKPNKPIIGLGGNSRVGRLKVWRPVVSTTSHELHDRLANSGSMNMNTETLMLPSEVTAKEPSQTEELPHGKQSPEDDNAEYGMKEAMDAELNSVEMGNLATRVCPSTLEAVSYFLSERWLAAVNDPDTVVLSVEAKEEFKDKCEDINNQVGDLSNPPKQQSKVSLGLPVIGKCNRGYWKQGCSATTMAAGLRISGKMNNVSGAARLAGYRYVPK